MGKTSANIGVSLSHIQVDPEDQTILSFEVEADAEGPGGWTGILLNSEYQSFVVPLQIVSDGDETLTMKLEPEALPPGTRNATLKAQIGPHMELTGVSEVQSGIDGAHFSWPRLDTPHQASITADIAFDIDVPASGIPVCLTTAGGAAVGYLGVQTIKTDTVGEQNPWKDWLEADEFALLTVEPLPSPTLVNAHPGEQDLAEGTLQLVSKNGLDVVDSGVDEQGSLFLLEDQKRMAVFKTTHQPSGLPSEIHLKSMGKAVVNIQRNLEDNIISDPCIQPVLLKGYMSDAFQVDRFYFDALTCRLKISVLARTLVPHPFETPDLWLERRDMTDKNLDDAPTLGGENGSLDPTGWVDSGDLETVVAIGSQTATIGNYLVNLRRPDLIRSLGTDSTGSYIVLEVDPAPLDDNLHLELHDVLSGVLLEELALSGVSPGSDNRLVIGSVAMTGVDIVGQIAILPENSPVALSLRRGVTIVDAIQIGGDKSSFGEGAPLLLDPVDPEPFCSRAGGIDTNNNASDFVCGWKKETF